MQVTISEIDLTGNREHILYEFNLADIDLIMVWEITEKDKMFAQLILDGNQDLITVYEDLFVNIGLSGNITYTASLDDGSSLPSYISFNSETITLTISLSGSKSLKEIMADLDIIITGTDSDGYMATVAFALAEELVSGQPILTMDMKIYPNPANEFIYLENNKSELMQIEIYDITGKLVKSKMLNDKLGVIDIQALESSIYLMKITIQNEERMVKIIKN